MGVGGGGVCVGGGGGGRGWGHIVSPLSVCISVCMSHPYVQKMFSVRNLLKRPMFGFIFYT